MTNAKKATSVYLLWLLGGYPLFTGPNGYADILEWKFRALLLTTVLWAAVVGICLLRQPPVSLSLTPAHGFSLLLVAIGLVSALRAERVSESLLGGRNRDGWITLLLYVLIFWGVSLFGSIRWWKVLAVPVVVNFALVILQLADRNPLGLFPGTLRYRDRNVAYGGEYLGTLGNVDILSGFLAFCTIFFLVCGWKSRRKRWLVPGGIAFLTLLLIRVRLGLLATCVTLVLLPALLAEEPLRHRARRLLPLLGAAALAALWWIPWSGGTLSELHQMLHGNWDSGFGSGRLLIWKESLKLSVQHPLLGSGPGSTAWRYPVAFLDQATGRVVRITNAHNACLGLLVNLGLAGLLASGGVLLSCPIFRPERFPDPMRAALGAAALAYLIQDFFNLNLCITAPLLWASLAMPAAPQQTDGDSDPGPRTHTRRPPPEQPRRGTSPDRFRIRQRGHHLSKENCHADTCFFPPF